MSELDAHLASLDRAPLPLPSRAGRYRGYADVIEALARSGARALHLGQSVEGTPLFAFDVGEPEAAKVSFVVAGLHAMEWIGVEAALQLLARLVARPPRDRLVRVVPIANVDGYRRVERRLRHGAVQRLQSGIAFRHSWRSRSGEGAGSGPAPSGISYSSMSTPSKRWLPKGCIL